jgi:hypothetical protein
MMQIQHKRQECTRCEEENGKVRDACTGEEDECSRTSKWAISSGGSTWYKRDWAKEDFATHVTWTHTRLRSK